MVTFYFFITCISALIIITILFSEFGWYLFIRFVWVVLKGGYEFMSQCAFFFQFCGHIFVFVI